MSTIVSSFVKDRASTRQIDTLTMVDATPKAYACWNGTTMAVATTFNISSIQDNGVGQWTPILTTPLAVYGALMGSSHNAGINFCLWSGVPGQTGGMTCTSYPLGSTTAADSNTVTEMMVGRLA